MDFSLPSREKIKWIKEQLSKVFSLSLMYDKLDKCRRYFPFIQNRTRTTIFICHTYFIGKCQDLYNFYIYFTGNGFDWLNYTKNIQEQDGQSHFQITQKPLLPCQRIIKLVFWRETQALIIEYQ